MKLMRFMGATAVATGITLALAGIAVAADTTTINITGPDSTQKVETNNTTSITSTNTNVVHVVNENLQQATTGDVKAEKNTSVSGEVLGTGAASNTSTTTTEVAISNESAGGLGGSTGTGPVPTGGSGGTVSGNSGGSQPAGGRGGSVLGASTGGMGGGGTLPAVGPVNPVDVSALRAAWQPKTDAPTTNMVKQTQGITNLMLAVASLLSLLGAIGSAFYVRRKEGSV